MSLQEKIQDYASQLPTPVKLAAMGAFVYGLSSLSQATQPVYETPSVTRPVAHYHQPDTTKAPEIEREYAPDMTQTPEPLYTAPK